MLLASPHCTPSFRQTLNSLAHFPIPPAKSRLHSLARLALACLNLGGPKAAWHGDPSVIFSALAKGPTGARSSSFQGLPQRRRWIKADGGTRF